MSDDTQSETQEENDKQKKMNEEKINSLRKLLGPWEAYGSSNGLAWDLQTERTRFVEYKLHTFEERMKARPPEFSEDEWKALSRTTRYPDNSTLGGSRIPKAFYDYYRFVKTISAFWKECVNKYYMLKFHIQTLKLELYECDIDHPDHSSIVGLFVIKDREYNSSKRDFQELEKRTENCILWARENFLNIKKVKKMVLDDKTVKEFLQTPDKAHLMRIVIKSFYIYEKNEKIIDDFYGIPIFKSKYDLTSESQEDSEDNEDSEDSENSENLERTIKKPKRNDNEFLEHLKELNFMCPGVPGEECLLKSVQLKKEKFDYDHIWPWKFSKDDTRRNKRPLCKLCHTFKTNNIDKHLKDDHEAVQMLQDKNMLPDRLMRLVNPHCIPCESLRSKKMILDKHCFTTEGNSLTGH